MNTYYSANIKNKNSFEIETILDHLKNNSDNLTTIQWNMDDDSLYTVSSLPEWITNSSDHGYIWHYEPASQLLAEIQAQL